MRVGLNLLYLIPGQNGGTQTYAESLINALAAIDAEDDFTVFVSAEGAALALPAQPNFHKVVCPVRAVRREVRYAYEQLVFPWRMRGCRLDVLHSLGYVGPLAASCPQVVSVHDLIYRGHQAGMTGRKQKALEFFVRQAVRRFSRIITISENSKREIVADNEINPEKITVTYLAGRPPAAPSTPAQRVPVLSRYGITAPYVLAFSSPNPVKNISRLLEAFAAACADLPHQIVLIGHPPAGTSFAAEAERVGLGGRVIAAGYVPGADIGPLLQGADLFAFPSLYEGFGLPVLDAQQEEVPVICSQAASLPEVAGDGALLFDPLSPEAIQEALRAGLLDEPLRARLRAQGRANAAKFTWERTARQTLDVYRQVGGAEKK